MPAIKSAAFIEYLDKEMNIMGILSVFCVAVAGLSIDRTAGAAALSALSVCWQRSAPLIASGAFAALLAALFFYRQRSTLAWYAGQLALAEVTAKPEKAADLLADADAWETWISYRFAFIWLHASFLWLGLAAARQILPALLNLRQRWAIGIPLVAIGLVSLAIQIVFKKYPSQPESPWRVAWLRIRSRDSQAPDASRERQPPT